MRYTLKYPFFVFTVCFVSGILIGAILDWLYL